MAEKNSNEITKRKFTIKSYFIITILLLTLAFLVNLLLFVFEKGGNAIPIIMIVLASLIIVILTTYIIIDIVRIYRKKSRKKSQ
ncbi:MAG: hypothetical protein FK732_05670 [Asgard group archaeon]|nr:hypothetical protein [Asgard group archaeon]